MTYARARLWLGITGVGSWVVLTELALIFGWPARFLSGQAELGATQMIQLAFFIFLYALLQSPLDFLGGYWLPRRYGKSQLSFDQWVVQYLKAVTGQATLFFVFGTALLGLGQMLGTFGSVLVIIVGIVLCFVIRNQLLLSRPLGVTSIEPAKLKVLTAAREMAESWELPIAPTTVVAHQDIGFTGGIIGLGKLSQIILPKSWLEFSAEQLAVAIARRSIAINSGSYSRGLLIAVVWNVSGFLLCTQLPSAGIVSVAGLVTTICGFTLWSFVGLLTLPTISRNASLQVDQRLAGQGVSADLIIETARTLDQRQDGEPQRPTGIETIFHPIPSVNNRVPGQRSTGIAAWNVARTTIFFSWPCLGLLNRAVHCNAGRPELWMMLPSD